MSTDQSLRILAEDLAQRAHHMIGLQEDLRGLGEHVRAEDHDAILWRARRILESLLNHAIRSNGGNANPKADLETKVHQAGLADSERIVARTVQQLGNIGAHGRADDVYAGQPASNRVATSLVCLQGLATILTSFVDRHPAPPGALSLPPAGKPPTVPPPPPSTTAADDSPEGGIDDVIEVNFLESLGAMTVATARDRELSPTIAKLTGITQRRVQNRLDSVGSRTRVENVFSSEWGSPDVLAKVTVSTARTCGLLPWISTYLGLEAERVRNRLGAAHGKTHLRSVFEAEWAAAEQRSDNDDEPTDTSGGVITYDEIGSTTIAQLEKGEATWLVAHLTGLSDLRVRNRLRSHNGRTLVRNVFPEWDDPSTVGRMTAKRARAFQASSWIARYLDMKEATVLSKLAVAPGKAHVRTVFADRWG